MPQLTSDLPYPGRRAPRRLQAVCTTPSRCGARLGVPAARRGGSRVGATQRDAVQGRRTSGVLLAGLNWLLRLVCCYSFSVDEARLDEQMPKGQKNLSTQIKAQFNPAALADGAAGAKLGMAVGGPVGGFIGTGVGAGVGAFVSASKKGSWNIK